MTAKRVLSLTLDDCIAEDFNTKTPHFTDIEVQYELKVRLEDGSQIDANPDMQMFWSALLDAVVATASSEECTMTAEESKRVLSAAFSEVIRILDRNAAIENLEKAPVSLPMHVH